MSTDVASRLQANAAAELTRTTIIGGDGADTLSLQGADRASIFGGAGVDSILFAQGISTSTIRGGTGSDSLSFTGVSSSSIFGGTDGASFFTASGDVIRSTLVGGTGADTFTFGAGSTSANSLVIGGAGNEVISFNNFATATSIVGGAGADSVIFSSAATNAAGSNTYFFGANGGADTIAFANVSGGIVIAVSDSYGLATSSFTFTSSTSLVAFGSAGNTIQLSGAFTGTAINNINTLAAAGGISFTTVTEASITSLG